MKSAMTCGPRRSTRLAKASIPPTLPLSSSNRGKKRKASLAAGEGPAAKRAKSTVVPGGDHPFHSFKAPRGITAGSALKDIMSPSLCVLIAQCLSPLHPGFDSERFVSAATQTLKDKTLTERGRAIADLLAEELPSDFREAQPLLIAALGPHDNRLVEAVGLRSFFYYPWAFYISKYGTEHFDLAMEANFELTKRFTAEFSIRPYLELYEDRCLALLTVWAKDECVDVRRLVSEGTRPRLPWASHLKNFVKDPSPVLPLLEMLKDDPELYVRRSVANHIGDILKDHPKLGFDICQRWVDECSGLPEDSERRKNRFWMVRHAVRLPAKKNNVTALALRRAAKA